MTTPSTPAATSSNVDMLRIEQPQTAIEIYHGIRASLNTVEIQQPAAWVRLLVQQQRQAHRDLRELKRALDDKFDRTDLEVIEIERNYQVLCEAVQYLYAQQEADSTASHEWIQTERMRTANASQQFTADVWRMIVEKNAETTMAYHQRGLQIARLNDALAFIQTADGQRRQEQANFNHNVEQWAATQQATTEKLAANNAAIKADLTAIRKKAEELKAQRPTYLQTARRTARPPAILEEPAVAAGGPGGTGPPPRPPKISLAPSELSEDSDRDDTDLYSTPGPETSKTEKGKGKEEGKNNDDDEFTPERLARMIGERIRAAQAGASPQPARPEAVQAPRLKMENPLEYDGKPTTPFNTWWESVEDYLSFYPGTSEAQKIAWVGTQLTGTAKAWHLHRRKITRRTGDTWGAYSEAIQTDFRDSREAANALEKIGQLRDKGDIKAYFVEFRALNIYAGVTGESLQEKIDHAMPSDILEMRFAHNAIHFLEDGDFLTATYEVGIHVEKRKRLEAARRRQEGGGNKDSQGSGKGSGKTERSGKSWNTGRKEVNHKQSGKADSGGQTARSGNERIWENARAAWAGVDQAEIDSHKKDNQNGCWRCGDKRHHTTECYAKATKKGTPLPTKGTTASSSSTEKGKRLADDAPTTESLAPKQAKVAATKTGDSDMREGPFWVDSSDEADF